MIISLTNDLVPYALGAVIKNNVSTDELTRISSISVQVHNNIWSGTFIVPDAVGFSTPIASLIGGKLKIHVQNDNCTINNTISNRLMDWYYKYSSRCSVSSRERMVSDDELTCVVCRRNYQSHERVHRLMSCSHQFHTECIRKYLVDHCVTCQGNASFNAHCLHPVNNQILCPICQTSVD
jgi:hypothetical protein